MRKKAAAVTIRTEHDAYSAWASQLIQGLYQDHGRQKFPLRWPASFVRNLKVLIHLPSKLLLQRIPEL
jgi:hypothetical protein